MQPEVWTAVENYISEHLLPHDQVLEDVLEASQNAGLSAVHVPPAQGKLLHLLALTRQARRILEIGTLGAYSTIWLARALPSDGKLITLEKDPKTAAVAQANIARAGLEQIIELRVGAALDSLAQIAEEGQEPFDMVFIDADRRNFVKYLNWAMKLTQRGSLIVMDNVVRSGAILDETQTDDNLRGVRELYDALAAEPRLRTTAIQTVGSKGYDGFALGVVVSD
jgi:Predicted O-methyltransferase